MKTIKELSDRQIKLAWISSKSLYEICKKLEIHDNTYYIEGITEKFSVDCCNHHMAGINNIARIKKYGDIKEIKRA